MSDMDQTPKRDASHAMLIRLPEDVFARLKAQAQRRTIPLATLARQFIKERLDQIEECGGE